MSATDIDTFSAIIFSPLSTMIMIEGIAMVVMNPIIIPISIIGIKLYKKHKKNIIIFLLSFELIYFYFYF